MKERVANLIVFTLIVVILVVTLSLVGIIKVAPKKVNDEIAVDPIEKIKNNYALNPIKIPYDTCIVKGFTIKECEPHIYTINPELAKEISSKLEPIVKRRNDRGMNISITKVDVLNLAGRFQVMIDINCSEMTYKDDKLIIKNIAEILGKNYPLDFSEKSHRSSFADIVGCSIVGTEYKGDPINSAESDYQRSIWRIQDGEYESLT